MLLSHIQSRPCCVSIVSCESHCVQLSSLYYREAKMLAFDTNRDGLLLPPVLPRGSFLIDMLF